MKIVCPHCNFTKEIDPAKLPPNAKRATCPKCKQKFDIRGPAPAPPPPPADPEATEIIDYSAPDLPPIPATPAAPKAPPPPIPDIEATKILDRPAPEPPPLPTGEAAYGGESGIPWEDRPGGFFGDLFKTVKMVLFSPVSFFESMPTEGGIKAPLIFGLICGTLGYVVTLVWMMAILLVGVLPSLPAEFSGEMGMVMSSSIAGIIGQLIFAPIQVIIGMFIGTAIVHVLLMIVRGAGSGFEATFRVIGYTHAVQLLVIVPVLGWIAAGIWSPIVIVIGMAKAHNVGYGRVVMALIVIPIALFLLLAVGMAILIPIISGSIG